MQDRFKFRFWDKETQTMQKIPMVELRHRIILDKIFADDRVIFMQSTGLRDSSGKLIYEGDIVEVQYIGAQIPLFKNIYDSNPKREVFEIYCDDKWLKFYAKNDNYRKTCEIHSLDLDKILNNTYNKIYTVIGNIYENPRLLESEDL